MQEFKKVLELTQGVTTLNGTQKASNNIGPYMGEFRTTTIIPKAGEENVSKYLNILLQKHKNTGHGVKNIIIATLSWQFIRSVT